MCSPGKLFDVDAPWIVRRSTFLLVAFQNWHFTQKQAVIDICKFYLFMLWVQMRWKNTNDIHVKKFNWWGICPAAIHVIPIKRQYIYKKTIYDIGTEILKFQCLNCFKTRLFCKSIIPEDSKISRRDLSFASVKSRFKAILKKVKFSTQNEIYRICRLSTK